MISEEITESAKAVQEVAKTTKAGIEATEKVGSFVSRIIKQPLDEAAGMITDRLKFSRWERQQRYIERANKYIEEKNIEGELRAVPPKIALPVIENASLEENNELQDIWAYFLASAVDPNFDGSLRTAYIDIIKQLEIIDVHILNHIYRYFCDESKLQSEEARKNQSKFYAPKYDPQNVGFIFDGITFPIEGLEIRHKVRITDLEIYKESIDNLMRVKCISSIVSDGKAGVWKTKEGDHTFNYSIQNETSVVNYNVNNLYEEIYITSLGISFAKACIPPNKS